MLPLSCKIHFCGPKSAPLASKEVSQVMPCMLFSHYSTLFRPPLGRIYSLCHVSLVQCKIVKRRKTVNYTSIQFGKTYCKELQVNIKLICLSPKIPYNTIHQADHSKGTIPVYCVHSRHQSVQARSPLLPPLSVFRAKKHLTLLH